MLVTAAPTPGPSSVSNETQASSKASRAAPSPGTEPELSADAADDLTGYQVLDDLLRSGGLTTRTPSNQTASVLEQYGFERSGHNFRIMRANSFVLEIHYKCDVHVGCSQYNDYRIQYRRLGSPSALVVDTSPNMASIFQEHFGLKAECLLGGSQTESKLGFRDGNVRCQWDSPPGAPDIKTINLFGSEKYFSLTVTAAAPQRTIPSASSETGHIKRLTVADFKDADYRYANSVDTMLAKADATIALCSGVREPIKDNWEALLVAAEKPPEERKGFIEFYDSTFQTVIDRDAYICGSPNVVPESYAKYERWEQGVLSVKANVTSTPSIEEAGSAPSSSSQTSNQRMHVSEECAHLKDEGGLKLFNCQAATPEGVRPAQCFYEGTC